MRVVDAESPLTVAHQVPEGSTVAIPDPVGLRLPPVRRLPRTVCGIQVGAGWIEASRYSVPDCPDCGLSAAVEVEQETLL